MSARRVIALVAVLLAAAGSLGLVGTNRALASCPGPQLGLQRDGASVAPRRVGAGDDERVVYDVPAAARLRVVGSNLTYDCFDTDARTDPGCSGPSPTAPRSPAPIAAPDLVLSQGSRRWTLVRDLAISPDLTARSDVTLPVDVEPGAAELRMESSSGPAVLLVLDIG